MADTAVASPPAPEVEQEEQEQEVEHSHEEEPEVEEEVDEEDGEGAIEGPSSACEGLPGISDTPSGGQPVIAKLLISNAAAGSVIGKVGAGSHGWQAGNCCCGRPRRASNPARLPTAGRPDH